MSKATHRRLLFISLLIATTFHLAKGLPPKQIDLCGGTQEIDLTPLNSRSPWSAVKTVKSSSTTPSLKTTHQIDILTCHDFNNSADIPENCKNSSICHTIRTSSSQVTSIGYVPIQVQHEYKTNLVRYIGSQCDDKLNYTIDIRFICGNNLGYPSYPPYSITNSCKTILYWETAAACKGSTSDRSFGINESPCYVVDKEQGQRYDLSPLIRPKGSYKVWSSEGDRFYINVCSDATDKCGPDSSACIRSENGQPESIGSYKWSNIELKRSSEAVKHDYIELSYKSKNSKCNSPTSTLNESTTNIRFICPSKMPSPHRYPILVSSLDCRYEIEWVTDYACPQEELQFSDKNCIVDGVDLNPLRSDKFYEFNDIVQSPGDTNVTLLLNVCGSVPSDKCSENSSVCLLKSGNQKTAMYRKKASFLKADGRLSVVYVSSGASCNSAGGNSKIERAVVEFECDPNAATSQPELMAVEECSFLFKWRTKHVCPLIAPTQALNCTFVDDELGIQMDLSSLTLKDGFYDVQRYQHDPKLTYLIPKSARILLNICGALSPIPLNYTKECAQSSACLVLNKNTSISLGHFRQPLTYNKALKTLQLRYTGGHDPKTGKERSTLLNFHCESWSHNNEPFLIDFDESSGQYTIEFNTPSACPLYTTKGTDCMVTDPITRFVYDLKPLASKKFYSVKTDKYDFELNVCQPIVNGSCGADVAICQIEHNGEGRKFSLGKFNQTVFYWNTLLNMTFVGGTSYNDANKTPRRSHISFICDHSAQNGFPEFAGEKDRAYFFRWYTSLACPSPPPKVTHCVYENATHFFDLTPLALDRGNQFVLSEKKGTIVYLNFCRPLNRIREDMLHGCKANSGICLVDLQKNLSLSLGEPVSHPFMGFDGTIYLLYNNGDQCPYNKSLPITSSIQLICSPDMEEDLSIDYFDAYDDPVGNEECTYNFVVHTPLACPRSFNKTTLENCIYTDPRTNLSANLGQLTSVTDYAIQGSNGPQSTFSLNICKPVKPLGQASECKDSAVCFRAANNSVVSYGSVKDVKLYFEGPHLHVRYTNGSVCDSLVDGRTRSTDIEFICDETKHNTAPSLYFQNHCLAKFQWRTSAVCNLMIPSCSIVDDKSGYFYSLRPLASMSHAWNVSSSTPNEFYLINVCKPLPVNHNCSTSAGACKCKVVNGLIDCSANLGKVSDHELTIDANSNDLILTYEDGDKICDGSVAKTQIRFRCNPAETGHSGPQLMSVKDCTHHFFWDTIFACHLQNISSSSIELILDEDFVVHDARNGLNWDLRALFDVSLNVTEQTRFNDNDNYTYVFDFKKKLSSGGNCANSAICQVKRKNGFSRDIGSFNNWHFFYMGHALYLNLQSANSQCGRHKLKNATSKIRFLCSESAGVGSPHFVFESQECDYFFVWETSLVCQMLENRPDTHKTSQPKRSGISPGWIVFSLSLFALFAFAGWLFVSSSTKRDDVVYHIRRLFRRNEAPMVPFRYQQLSH